MCGIAGVLDYKCGRSWAENVLKMNDIQAHRGPDDTGTYVDDDICMGHTRLSIIDVSDAGHQPMQVGDLFIVFNGEIYNYVELRKDLESIRAGPFKSKSDTEVLLWAYKMWGKACLERLNGMFSFAIWDRKKQELFCARDRLGIKPFYYYFGRKQFAFSSEIKTLFPHCSAKPNYKVIQQYLVQGSYGLPDETFFDGIKSLPHGHYLMMDSSLNLTIHQYWGKNFNDDKMHDEDKTMEQYLDLMSDSIRLRLRSDVPIGLNVSSGLDSSILLGVIDRYLGYKNAFNAYTYTCDDPAYDECILAGELLENRPHKWHKCVFTEDMFYDSVIKMQYFLDEPFGGLPTLAESRIYERGRGDQTIVFLSGEGMDEQWAGYDYYMNVNEQRNINNISVVQGSKNPLCANCIDPLFIQDYIPIEYPSPFNAPIDNLRFRDIFYTKMPRALRTNDRISMAYGTELRVPFMDYRMIEFAFRMPFDFLIRNGVQKFLLRKISAKILPLKTANREKRKLQTPQREWLKNASWVRDILYSDSFGGRNIFDIRKVKDAYSEYLRGNYDNSFFLWQWLNLEIWFRTFID